MFKAISRALGAPVVHGICILFSVWSTPPSAAEGARAYGVPGEPQTFDGRIRRNLADSTGDWPDIPTAPSDAPNVVIWLLDDVGYGQISSFGGPVQTPTIDRLAGSGLRYSNFHATPLCSPSRAALLTGRNPHSIGMGSHALTPAPFPGYHTFIPKSAATFARLLQQRGYSTLAVGKWDHTPQSDLSIAGPFDRWPSGQGFDHFYGFLGADSDHFAPSLWRHHTPVQPSAGREDYFLTTDLTDEAIELISAVKSARPDRPFLLYWATGAAHAPHHAPEAWRERYRGKFDAGWDVMREQTFARQQRLGLLPAGTRLAPRNPQIERWSDLSAEQKHIYARQMELFAAQLSHADHEFGRLVDTLAALGELDNTLILVTSDNGASAEGGLEGTYNEFRMANGLRTERAQNLERLDVWGAASTYPHYHAGWAMAGNTPFRHFKATAHAGGHQVFLVAHWPKRIRSAGEIRRNYHHLIDLAPTILASTGITAPKYVDGVKQQPIEGIAMNYSFDDPRAPDLRTVQYYELGGNRSIYSNGWTAVTLHAPLPWESGKATTTAKSFDTDQWELYHVARDFSESEDIATREPQKLAELQKLFEAQALQHNVYPLKRSGPEGVQAVKAKLAGGRHRYEYFAPGAHHLHEVFVPQLENRAHEISAEIDVPPQGADGALLAVGGSNGGFALFIQDGQPVFEYNYFSAQRYRIESTEPLPAGQVRVAFKFTPTAAYQGRGTLLVNGAKVAEGEIPNMARGALFSTGSETFDIGMDAGTAVSDRYAAPFPFEGTIVKVSLTLDQP